MKRNSGLIVLGLLLVWTVPSLGAERTAADLLPETTAIYAELQDVPTLVAAVREHPARNRIQQLDGVEELLGQKEYLELKAVVSIVEARLGMRWPEIFSQAAGRGIYLGVDAASEGVALLAQAENDEVIPKLIDSLTELARADAKSKGEPDPIKEGQYRGISVYEVDKAKLAVFDRWLLITNKDELGEYVVDQHLDGKASTLAESSDFQNAKRPERAMAWSYLNLNVLREAGLAKELYRERSDNLVAELIFGGVMDVLRETPHLTIALQLSAQAAELDVSVPSQPAWVSEAREHYFGADGKGAAPPLLELDDTILSMSLHRDLGQMWLRSGDLFDDNTNDELAQADSNLSNLFAGRDFGEDILGAMRPEFQFVVVRQSFADSEPIPQVKLPAFALAWRLKDPDRMRPELRRIFQSAIGFLNVVGAMNGQPQLDQDIEKKDDQQLVTAQYLTDGDADPKDPLPINFNFSPSVGFAGDRFILSSTKALAQQVMDFDDTTSDSNGQSNSAIRVMVGPSRDALIDNRESLIAQNMLEDGNSREEAEAEITSLFDIMTLVEDLSLDLSQPYERLSLKLQLNFADEADKSE